ncbi:MAG: sigma-54-dependent Fis family transcriptional regulator, partial [Candidatus Marinimicrobia bacterium]|nr:sigma-54-dependent Fis family transcriptional regulator [Candidatus Neomarinimicrobiota bacterium]
GGTLFLDEVADIPLNFQVKLLRVLQNGDYQRLGSSQTQIADIRIISASNKNITDMIQNESFRADLYYRLNVVSITLPSLKERKEDIPVLSEHFVKKHAARNRRDVTGIHPEALNALMKYSFPGNVRELENMVERAVILTRHENLQVKDFLLQESLANSSEVFSLSEGSLAEHVEFLERKLIGEALELSSGIQTKAAEMLGITERNLRYKLQKYELTKDKRT